MAQVGTELPSSIQVNDHFPLPLQEMFSDQITSAQSIWRNVSHAFSAMSATLWVGDSDVRRKRARHRFRYGSRCESEQSRMETCGLAAHECES